MGVMVGGVNIPDAGIETPDSPELEWQGGLIAVTRKYWVPRTYIKTYLEALVSGTADAVYTDALLNGVGVNYESPKVYRVELRYEPDNWSSSLIGPVGSVQRSADANPLEVPVAKSPNSPSDAEIEDAVKDGIEAVLVPMPVYRRMEVKSSFTWTQANIIGSVAKIDNTPEGMTSPDSGKWLTTEHRVSEKGGVVEEEYGWQYNPTGWDTTLYDSVA